MLKLMPQPALEEAPAASVSAALGPTVTGIEVTGHSIAAPNMYPRIGQACHRESHTKEFLKLQLQPTLEISTRSYS